VDHELQSSLSEKLKLQDAAGEIFAPTVEFDDVDIDDEIDPALKEEIDRWAWTWIINVFYKLYAHTHTYVCVCVYLILKQGTLFLFW